MILKYLDSLLVLRHVGTHPLPNLHTVKSSLHIKIMLGAENE